MKIIEFKKLDEDSQIECLSDIELDDKATFKWSFFSSILEDKSFSDETRIEILIILGLIIFLKNFKVTL